MVHDAWKKSLNGVVQFINVMDDSIFFNKIIFQNIFVKKGTIKACL